MPIYSTLDWRTRGAALPCQPAHLVYRVDWRAWLPGVIGGWAVAGFTHGIGHIGGAHAVTCHATHTAHRNV